jgi:hypothetical protein
VHLFHREKRSRILKIVCNYSISRNEIKMNFKEQKQKDDDGYEEKKRNLWKQQYDRCFNMFHHQHHRQEQNHFQQLNHLHHQDHH